MGEWGEWEKVSSESAVGVGEVVEEGGGVVDVGSAEDDFKAGVGGVELGDLGGLLVGDAANDEDDDVLGFGGGDAGEGGVVLVLELGLVDGVEGLDEERDVLRVDVLDALERGLEGVRHLGHEGALRAEEAGPAHGAAAVAQDVVDEGDFLGRDPGVLELGLDPVEVGEALVAEGVEEGEAELVGHLDGARLELVEEFAPLRRAVVVAGDLLLELRDVHQGADVDQARELGDEGDVLRDVEALGPEGGVSLDEVLHVLDRADLLVHLGLGLVVVEQSLDGAAQVAKVRVPVFREEVVLRA
mmetsp:Transcript_7831/g.23985  ORF Transcript_7831/g.23985 Transcript_7831/m.23985 type:complete len:300 (+) Transcript_7831:387-1286(+)